MLRKLLMLLLLPPLLIGAAVLVMIGLKDLDLLVAVITRLLVVAIIIGIPVILTKMTILPGRSLERPFRNVVRGFSLVPHDPKGSHYRTVGVKHLPDTGNGPATHAQRRNGGPSDRRVSGL